MSHKTFTLEPLRDLSQMRMETAAKRLGELLSKAQAVELTLVQLTQYRDEYETRFREAAQAGLKPDEWQNYHAFLVRLDGAIEQQRSMVETSKQHTAEGQQEWLDKRNRVKAFDALSERHKAAQVREENRMEQRQQDEHAARKFQSHEE